MPSTTTSRPEASPAAPVALGIGLAVSSGVASAVQTRINGLLGVQLGDSVLAAVISFGVGLALLLIGLAASPAMRAGAGRLFRVIREKQLPWWMLLGGLAGALTVFSQALTAAIVGVALFSVAVVAGQTVSSLIVDRIGLGPGGVIMPTRRRILSAAIAIAAVTVGVAADLSSASSWLLLVPVAAGFGLGWQQAVNGRVRAATDSAAAATLLNFVTGMTLLLIAFVASRLVSGGFAIPVFPSDAWFYVGGALGVYQVVIMAIVVRWTGVLVLGLSIISGQLVAALALDLASTGIVVTPQIVAGALLALLAVVIASGRSRRLAG